MWESRAKSSIGNAELPLIIRFRNGKFDQAQSIADEFALKAGVAVKTNEGLWGIRAQDDSTFLTYSGNDYCGMNLSVNEMTCCSKSAVDFVRKNLGQVWVFRLTELLVSVSPRIYK